ncbi:MAG: hypothetical protein U1F34_03560 [Gammaproteobacteria bacterium]
MPSNELMHLFEATTAALRGVETEIVQQREQQSAATDHFNEVQSKHYGVGADVARLSSKSNTLKNGGRPWTANAPKRSSSWLKPTRTSARMSSASMHWR